MDKKQIAIFGGCFNPPVNSHFSLAQQLINEKKQIEKIVFVPVNDKYEKSDLLSNENRYNMLKLVCDKNDKFEVSRMEIDNTRQLYTLETMRNFQEIYPDYEITFIIGSDNLKELDTWEYASELLKEFRIYVLIRAKDNIDEIIKNNMFLMNNKNSFIEAKNDIVTNLSSTYIRKKLREKKSIRYLAPDEIVKYIEENNLYI